MQAKKKGKVGAKTKGRQGKQQELPGVTVDDRKIVAIEAAAEKQEKMQARADTAAARADTAMDQLVEIMVANKKTEYVRHPWGKVTLKPGRLSRTKAQVVRD